MRPSTPLRWFKSLAPAKRGSRLVTSAFLLALLIAPGCSESPTSPGGLPEETLHDTAIIDLGPIPLEWTVVKLILRQGSTMNLDGDRVMCTFPKGALPFPLLNVLVTANMKLNAPRGTATRLDIDFQPSMVFSKPVVLKVDSNYLAGTGNKYTLWFYDPDHRRWEKVDEENITPGLPVLFEIDHYSAYAITR